MKATQCQAVAFAFPIVCIEKTHQFHRVFEPAVFLNLRKRLDASGGFARPVLATRGGLGDGQPAQSSLRSERAQMALDQRRPDAGLRHHSDGGTACVGADCQAKLHQIGATISMSGKGSCCGNTVVESVSARQRAEAGIIHGR
jgi:hypothetical protein